MYQINNMKIPCILSNRDVILRSNTGSGKSLAYLIPLLLLLIDYVLLFWVNHEQYETYFVYTDFVVLILVPSRELAIQIEDVVKNLVLQLRGVRTALIIGGESREQQVRVRSVHELDASDSSGCECSDLHSRTSIGRNFA